MDLCKRIRRKIVMGNEKGFTILEGLIASAVFGIFMVAVISLTVGAVKSNDLARDVTEATSLGADVIEQIALLPYNDLNLQGNSYGVPDAMDGKYSFAVNTAPNAILNNTMLITVTVSWRYKGLLRNVTLTDIKIDFI